MNSRIVFLLGAGASIPAGMPNTSEITAAILCGDDKYRHPNGGVYRFGQAKYSNARKPEEEVARVSQFIRRTREREIEVTGTGSSSFISYEQIYHFANEVLDYLLDSSSNPTLAPLIRELNAEMNDLLAKDELGRTDWKLKDLVLEASNFIEDIVSECLAPRTPLHRLKYLDIFERVLKETTALVDVFTLNHDTVLEQFLESRGLEYADGFGTLYKHTRKWDVKHFDNPTIRIRVFKLHGSISWRHYSEYAGNRILGSWYGIPARESEKSTPESHFSSMETSAYYRPLILVGTKNKIANYPYRLFAELHCRFYQTLAQTDQLVVCGFGFRDVGINQTIFEWLGDAPKRKMTIIHHSPQNLKDSIRPRLFLSSANDFESKGQFEFIPSRIENLEWGELRPKLVFR